MEVERTFLTVGVYDNAIVRWVVGKSGSNLDRFLRFLLPVSHVYLREFRVGKVFASYYGPEFFSMVSGGCSTFFS